MAQAYTTLRTRILNTLQDASSVVFSTAEIDLEITDALREIGGIVPYVVKVPYTIESRTGVASSTSAGNLIDTSESQFASGDVGKVVYNVNQKTWAVITSFTSTGQVALSKDIFQANDSYKIFNKESTNNKQINISDVTDYIEIQKAEYPIGTSRDIKKVSDYPDIIELDMTREPEDSKALTTRTQPETEVPIWFAKRHKVSQLTDTAGVLAATCAAAATTIAASSLQTSGTIEADQEFTIADVRGTYWTTAAIAITSNTASLTFYPPLESAIASTGVSIRFRQSTLTPELEGPFCDYVAGRTAVSKPVLLYQQVNTALTTIAAATIAIASIATRINSGTTYIAAGTVEAFKAVAVVLTAATSLSNITARLQAGTVYVAAGSVEAAKVQAIVLSAATALAAVSTRIAAATTYIASGSTEAAKISGIAGSAAIEVALINAEIDKASSAMTSGLAIINTVPVGGGAPEYMGQAGSDVNVGRGYLIGAQGYLDQAKSEAGATNSFGQLAVAELNSANARVNEAQGFLRQAQEDESLTNTYLGLAAREALLGGGYLSQAQGYLSQSNTDLALNASYLNSARSELAAAAAVTNEAFANMRLVSTRISVATGARTMETWGRQKMAEALAELRQIKGARVTVKYSRR